MKRFILFLLAGIFIASAVAQEAPIPFGVVKVFTGPQGESVSILEVNDGKEALVYFKGVGGALEDQTRMYTLESLGYGDRALSYKKKRGSKTHTVHVLRSQKDKWVLSSGNKEILLKYSKKDSENMTIQQILQSYKP